MPFLRGSVGGCWRLRRCMQRLYLFFWIIPGGIIFDPCGINILFFPSEKRKAPQKEGLKMSFLKGITRSSPGSLELRTLDLLPGY